MSSVQIVIEELSKKYEKQEFNSSIVSTVLSEVVSQYFEETENKERLKRNLEIMIFSFRAIIDLDVGDFINHNYYERAKQEAAEVINSASISPIAYCSSSVLALNFSDETYALHMTIQFAMYQLIVQDYSTTAIHSAIIMYLRGEDNELNNLAERHRCQ